MIPFSKPLKHWQKSTIAPLTLALLSGIATGCSVAPFEWWGLAWLGLAPLWGVIVASPLPALWLGAAWGAGFHGTAIFWITGVHPLTWMGVPWLASLGIALACWCVIWLWGAVFVGLWATLVRNLTQSWGSRLIVGTALWCGLEVLWRSLPLWWSSLSYTQSPHNLLLLHLGQLSGTTTITAVLVAFNGCLAAAWCAVKRPVLDAQKPRSPGYFATLAAILFVLAHSVGGYLYTRPLGDRQGFQVGIIQGNIPNEIKLSPRGLRQALEGYTTGYETLADLGVDVVLTPETALPVFWDAQTLQWGDSPAAHLYQAIRSRGVPAWVGTYQGNTRHYTNSLLTVSGDGEVLSRYDKVILVPLGEYIPFESVLGSVINRLSPLQAQMLAGEAGQKFETPFGLAAVSICYESAFPEPLRLQTALGGEIFLSAANNAHYAASMPQQHHAQDVMRAIELDRWAVRAANTGYSGIVDPHGRTLWKSPLNQYVTHAATVYPRQTKTLYVRWGDWLVWVFAGVGVLTVAYERVLKRRV